MAIVDVSSRLKIVEFPTCLSCYSYSILFPLTDFFFEIGTGVYYICTGNKLEMVCLFLSSYVLVIEITHSKRI